MFAKMVAELMATELITKLISVSTEVRQKRTIHPEHLATDRVQVGLVANVQALVQLLEALLPRIGQVHIVRAFEYELTVRLSEQRQIVLEGALVESLPEFAVVRDAVELLGDRTHRAQLLALQIGEDLQKNLVRQFG